ncbi:hypothetical protein B0J13DRAFT_559051 [Dactylonectria estremocensis]|uniref:Uncharacterized protein n=1 Tax=Dactylonectria estremocensis TaxID=1079267 RepID=A0A9P9EHE7_9HYPO|nr:hypothetical protein B0J13DRAFT_559051 [Dactylonectria estremocensis]
MGLVQAREIARHGFFSISFLGGTRTVAATLGDGFYLADKSQSSPSVHGLLTYIVFLFSPWVLLSRPSHRWPPILDGSLWKCCFILPCFPVPPL